MRLLSGFRFLALEKAGSPAHSGSGKELSGAMNSPISLTGVLPGPPQTPER